MASTRTIKDNLSFILLQGSPDKFSQQWQNYNSNQEQLYKHFQTCACVTHANTPWAKRSRRVTPRVRVWGTAKLYDKGRGYRKGKELGSFLQLIYPTEKMNFRVGSEKASLLFHLNSGPDYTVFHLHVIALVDLSPVLPITTQPHPALCQPLEVRNRTKKTQLLILGRL